MDATLNAHVRSLEHPTKKPGSDDLLHELAKGYGTPLYFYDTNEVRVSFAEFREAFTYEPLEIHYAIVCNKNRYLVRLLHQLGAGIHANTPGDAHAALNAGVPPERIVYSGTNLNSADFDFLIANGIRMNLDSLSQLRDLAARKIPTSVGLRILIDPVNRPNRIGVTAEELPEAVAISKSAGLRVIGLHMYAGTNTRKVARFVECFDRMIESSELLPDLEYIDLGGGYGVGYRENEPDLNLIELGTEVSSRMEVLSARRGRSITLVLEPGRTLVNAAENLLIRVVSVKERGGRRFIGVDSTVGNIVVESVYHSYHRIEAVHPRGPLLETPSDVCGNTTHSRDYLGRDCRLPELEPGDLLLMRDVGAYGYAMSSHFLNRPRPAEVVLDQGQIHLTTRRETLADLLSTQEQP